MPNPGRKCNRKLRRETAAGLPQKNGTKKQARAVRKQTRIEKAGGLPLGVSLRGSGRE